MNGFEVWVLLTVIPNLIFPICIFILLSLIALIIGGIMFFDGFGDEDKLKAASLCKKSFISLLFLSVLVVGIPQKEDMATIILVPYVTTNKEFKQLPENLIKKLNNYLTDPVDKGATE